MHGNHLIKSWSINQSVIALSSGEAEYYGLVKAMSVAMGIVSLCEDLGVTFGKPIEVKTDASAAIGIASRIGLGKIRHIEVSQLWLQEKVKNGKVTITKVDTSCNLADALTKGVDAAIIAKHLSGVGVIIRSDRHHLAPKVDEDYVSVDQDEEETQL